MFFEDFRDRATLFAFSAQYASGAGKAIGAITNFPT
jgi:hypothetical protein